MRFARVLRWFMESKPVDQLPQNSANLLAIQLCYSRNGTAPVLLDLKVAQGSTIDQVFLSLNPTLRNELEQMLSEKATFAVFGKKKTRDYVLSSGDRLEICRALIAQPMDARRRRALREHKTGKM